VDVKPSSVVALYRFTVPGLRQPIRIEVEISLREPVLRPPITVSTARIAHPSGVEPVVVSRLDDVELLAERVRALVVWRASRVIVRVRRLSWPICCPRRSARWISRSSPVMRPG
jgi:hypothetical protein